ncbi:MAG: hypothetical protein KGJ60_04495 [Verrucomicrobiota bacterium]|nr:hypothetical protein [Verrucomicrobiota bacterium]
MDFIKKHYEKILLGVVLLGLVFGLVFLPLYIIHDRTALAAASSSVISHVAKPLPPVALAGESNVIRRLETPYQLNFETTNRLFNPVQWQKAADGHLIKIVRGNEVGPDAVVVTRIIPLYFILRLESVDTNPPGVRYGISVERQAARVAWRRAPRPLFASVGDKNEVFGLLSVQGPPDAPTNLVLQLRDTGETVNVSKDKPYRRVDGYMADLKYPPEGGNWPGRRVGDQLRFAGDVYNIVAIGPDDVVLSAGSNEKKTTLHYSSQ